MLTRHNIRLENVFKFLLLSCAWLSIVFVTPTRAEEKPELSTAVVTSPVPESPASANSTNGYKPGAGDVRTLTVNVPGFISTGATITSYVAPAKSKLRVDTPERDGKVYVHFDRIGDGKDSNIGDSSAPYVEAGKEYIVNSYILRTYPSNGWGQDYGLLVVPYKYHFLDQSLTGAATIGGYFGIRYDSPGLGVALVMSAGLAVLPVSTQNDDGTLSTTNVSGFTAAGGIIATLSKAGMFQAGLLVGADWAGKDSQYKYEGQPWVALSFGINLTR